MIIMPTRDDAKAAVKTLLGYLEKDLEREGLLDTPERVIDSWDEIFSGYQMDAGRNIKLNFQWRRI